MLNVYRMGVYLGRRVFQSKNRNFQWSLCYVNKHRHSLIVFHNCFGCLREIVLSDKAISSIACYLYYTYEGQAIELTAGFV